MGAHEQGANATQNRWLTIPRTLSFIFNGDDVLLMKRAAHKRVFPNQYNGLGGHIERDEDPLTSARREIREESGLDVRDVALKAIYNIDAGEATGILLLVFTATSDRREVSANSEGTLHWVPRDAVYGLDLVEDLPLILPRILGMTPSDPPLFVHVSYDDQDAIQMRFANDDL
jgi:8-oxo-dGTP diphosphatase